MGVEQGPKLQIDLASPQFISTEGLMRGKPSEQKPGGDKATQGAFQDDGTYGLGDIIEEVRRIEPGISEYTARTRVDRAIKKDSSLGPSNVPHRGRGGGRLFTGGVARRLAEEASNPSNKRRERKPSQGPRISEEHERQVFGRRPLWGIGPDGNQNRVSRERGDRAIRELQIDLTRTVLSQLTEALGVDPFRGLPKSVLAIARSFLPQGIDLQSIIEIDSPNGLEDEFVVGLIVGVVEDFWDADEKQLIGVGRIVSVKERQIIDYCVRLKKEGYTKSGVIETVYNHFSVPLPEKYGGVKTTLGEAVLHADGRNGAQRRGARGTNWDRLGQQGSGLPKPYVPRQGRRLGKGHTTGF